MPSKIAISSGEWELLGGCTSPSSPSKGNWGDVVTDGNPAAAAVPTTAAARIQTNGKRKKHVARDPDRPKHPVSTHIRLDPKPSPQNTPLSATTPPSVTPPSTAVAKKRRQSKPSEGPKNPENIRLSAAAAALIDATMSPKNPKNIRLSAAAAAIIDAAMSTCHSNYISLPKNDCSDQPSPQNTPPSATTPPLVTPPAVAKKRRESKPIEDPIDPTNIRLSAAAAAITDATLSTSHPNNISVPKNDCSDQPSPQNTPPLVTPPSTAVARKQMPSKPTESPKNAKNVRLSAAAAAMTDATMNNLNIISAPMNDCSDRTPPQNTPLLATTPPLVTQPSAAVAKKIEGPTNPKNIRLAKQKTIVKSPMFMASPSSIYSAVRRYDSLLDALQFGNWDLNEDDSFAIIYLHFGGCPIFEQQFDSILSGDGGCSFSPPAIEHALNRSVRHLCGRECFLRAYHPIREFTLFWRDIAIEDSAAGARGCRAADTPPRRRRRMTKGNVLSGWSCKVCPAPPAPRANQEAGTENDRAKNPPPTVIFASPDHMEFKTKTGAVNYMNKAFSSLRFEPTPFHRTNSPSTALIKATTKIDPLYSPFGLLEELFLRDPWKLLVSTICLNVTTRPQVDQVLGRFLQRWPDAESTAQASWKEISRVISVLGLGTKRAKALVRFSGEYLALVKESDPFSLTEKQVRGMYNIGQYGWTAYKVFILKELPTGSVKVCDHVLQLYIEYQLGRKAADKGKSSKID